jgi:microcystin degradation protein MlrC
LAACHGANVAESVPDVDGDWLRQIRAALGPARPLIGTLDPHGNLSREMVAATDALVAYRTNPHTDQRERGIEAARLMARTLRGEVRPMQAASFPPLVINIERQETAGTPLSRHYELADQQRHRKGVLSNSILLGFPYADVEEMGSATIAVTDDDPVLAQRLADELARGLWEERESFIGQLLDVPSALAEAATRAGRVCLLDMGDNVGGGAPGDGTHLVRAIHEQSLPATFACLYDPEAVQRAEAAGVGAKVPLRVGDKTDDRHGEPLAATFTVRGLYEGRFRESEPRHGGFTDFDQGRTAVVETASGLTLMLTSRRMVPFSLQQLVACEIDPSAYRILVVKGVHAPVAAYASVCDHFLRVNTPGVTTADISTLAYRHRRRPLFPFERDFCWGDAQ